MIDIETDNKRHQSVFLNLSREFDAALRRVLQYRQTGLGPCWRRGPSGILKARGGGDRPPAAVFSTRSPLLRLTTAASSPDAEGRFPVQAPECGRAAPQPRRLHLRGPLSAGGSQRGLGGWHLTADRLQRLPARELHGTSQGVRHLG